MTNNMPPPPDFYRPSGGGAEEYPYFGSQVSRRTLLAGSMACTALARLGADTEVADRILPGLLYGTSPTTIDTIGATESVDRLAYVSERSLLYGGIGQGTQVSRTNAELLARGTYRDEPVSYVAYSPAGLTDAELASSYNKFEASTDKIDIVANSMGWVVLCRTLQEKRRQVYVDQAKNPARMVAEEHVGKRIRSVVLCSSPSNVLDVWNGQTIKDIVDTLNPTGTMSEKWLAELVDEMVNHHQPFGAAAHDAYRQLFSTLPPRLWSSQFVMLARDNTLAYARELQPFFHGTHFMYAMPKKAGDDHTVNVLRACPNMRDFARNVGAASFTECLMPYAAHADIPRFSRNRQARKWIVDIRNGASA